MRYSICFLIVPFLLFGCHGKSSSTNGNSNSGDSVKHAGAPLKPLKKGVVIDSVICSDDSSQIYAVYLPSHYDTAKKWPIIYFFDPHGVGNLPVLLYKDLAEKYGFIVAGTYNSKNGMQWDASEKVAQAFMKDAGARLSLDNSRIYTCGFSGGAMVAAMVAVADGGVAGVVSCGGSFPADHPPNHPFSYISFVGDKDFHYVSVKQLDKLFDSTSLAHQFIVFNGKHQWPPASYIDEAFQWLDADAMRMKTMPKNDSILKSIRESFAKEAEAWHKKGNTVQEYYSYKKLLNYLHDLDDVSQYAAKVKEFENSDAFKKYVKNEESFDAEESQQMQEFQTHLGQMDEGWWDTKITTMQKMIKKDTTSPVAMQTQRMLGYLSLIFYMGASQAYNGHNYPAANYFVGLYTKVDPTNPEHSYLSANLDMTSNNFAKALSDLREAIKLGFIDSKRLEQDPSFASLHNSAEYKALLKEIATKPQKIDLTK